MPLSVASQPPLIPLRLTVLYGMLGRLLSKRKVIRLLPYQLKKNKLKFALQTSARTAGEKVATARTMIDLSIVIGE